MRIAAGIDPKSSGIEYGPLHRTIMLKSVCANVRYVDFTTREELVKKYLNDPNVDVSLIPEIDIVTGGAPITEFLRDNSLDFVIASHILEHVPNFIGWLEANLRLLRVGGRIALAFPDRRYCFDLAKQPSSFHELVAAHLERRTKPNFAQICDHILNTCRVSTADVWDGKATADNTPTVRTTPRAIALLETLVDSTAYHDVHCWKFSDAEFLDMLARIKNAFQLPCEILSFFPTRRYTTEFYAALIKV
jgi:SAM-dependent methyltransferase